jgi:hypothetical protein
MRKKIKIRNVVFLVILCFSIGESIILPIFITGEMNNSYTNITTDDIYDFVAKSVILRKKAIFDVNSDLHRFYVNLKEDVEYIARIKITAEFGGDYLIRIRGTITDGWQSAIFNGAITNQKLETTYTSDGTGQGYVEIIYNTISLIERPEYFLYFNKTGFAGWWWIILSSIGLVAVVAFLLTFTTIGIISVKKRKKKKGKKKKRK